MTLNSASRQDLLDPEAGLAKPRGLMLLARPDQQALFEADRDAMRMHNLSVADAQAKVPILNPETVGLVGYSDALWDLDTDLIKAIQYHHCPEQFDHPLSHGLKIANQLAWQLEGKTDDLERESASRHLSTEALGLSQDQLKTIAEHGVVRLQESLEYDRETERLDVALRASTAFLNVLRAATLERVARENLELTESNLELARRRERLGVSSPAERYRWESEIATDRSDVIAAINRTDAARVALNQVLHRPLEEYSKLIPPDAD